MNNEIAMNPATESVEDHSQKSTVKILLLVGLQGLGGIFILSLFILSFTEARGLLSFLPYITGFNCAAAGFGFVTKRGGGFRGNCGGFFLLATLLAAGAGGGGTLVCPWEFTILSTDYVVIVAVAFTTVVLGGWLAVASQSDKKQWHNFNRRR